MSKSDNGRWDEFGLYLYTQKTTIDALKGYPLADASGSEDWAGFEFDKKAGSGQGLLYTWKFVDPQLSRSRIEDQAPLTEHELQSWQFSRTLNHNRGNRIVHAPGTRLCSIAEFLYSPKTLQRVIMPIISDLQIEYFEALAAGRRYKAEWVRLRGYWSLFKAVGLYSILKTLVEMWRKVSL